MKKIKMFIAAAAAALMLTACGDTSSKIDFTMPDSPTEFNLTTVADPADETKSYAAIEYNGKTYVQFGILNGELTQSDVGPRLGYVVQDDVKIEDIGIFPLTFDADQNYLISLDDKGIMQNNTIFRNSETVGNDIEIPSFIESGNFDYWK